MRKDYYGNAYVDGVCMLLNGLGKRCTECKKATWNECLVDGKCPPCAGIAPKPPQPRINGGRECDVSRGPCSCGAWH